MSKISFRDKWVSIMMTWSTRGILSALTTYESFRANPEAAFGVVRKLNTRNKLKTKHVLKFLDEHPV